MDARAVDFVSSPGGKVSGGGVPTEAGGCAAARSTIMAYQDYYHGPPVQDRKSFGSSSKPQLPNFEHFLRGAGQPELAQGTARRESIFENLNTAGHPSLPTPPLTSSSGPLSYWDTPPPLLSSPSGHSSILSSRPPFTPDSQRRASLALPIQAQHQARPARAYSSTNVERTYHDYRRGQYEHVIQEGDYPERSPENIHHGIGSISISREGPSADMVTSIWGVTKAGKPRKRLSQACITCREKKIKCDPGGGPRCSQCLRFNRECKFDTK